MSWGSIVSGSDGAFACRNAPYRCFGITDLGSESRPHADPRPANHRGNPGGLPLPTSGNLPQCHGPARVHCTGADGAQPRCESQPVMGYAIVLLEYHQAIHILGPLPVPCLTGDLSM